jgi:putative transposase
LERGEIKSLIREMASRTYSIPNSNRIYIAEGTIEAWYYAWKRGGIEALSPKIRSDKGESKLPTALQEAILKAKKEKPKRSINTLRSLLENTGLAAKDELSRSAVHRLLQQHGLSNFHGEDEPSEERRSFVASRASDIWYGDVMHGPKFPVSGRNRKVYLVSLMDDASRLLTHSAFCLGETAIDIEGVLKQAVLKRGLPKKLVIDNGPAYRARTLQEICARLEIRLIYCRPYHPTSKGKLEKWHSFVRSTFLSELDRRTIHGLDDLNARLWAWLDQFYHQRVHAGLGDDALSPLQRWQQDLINIRPLGSFAHTLDAIFLHRYDRLVRKDGTISFQSNRFEVPFELVGKTVRIVVDPHTESVIAVESKEGQHLGHVTPLDLSSNLNRKRVRPLSLQEKSLIDSNHSDLSFVETLYQKQTTQLSMTPNQELGE